MKFTKTVKEIYEGGLITTTWENAFEIFNESYRNVLVEKIKGRYWYTEVGYDDLERWNFEMANRMSIIMPLYNDMYNAYNELKGIGFNKLLKESIGSYTLSHTNVNGYNNTDGATQNDTTNQVEYSVNDGWTKYGSTVTDTYGRTDTNTQEKDGKTLQLHADTPMSKISENLSNDSQWSNQPYVSDADKIINNNGTTKNTAGGSDTNAKTGKDKTHSESSSKDTINNSINQHINNTDNHDTWLDSDTKNYDMMTTYKKILDILKNIDLCIINDLRDLFMFTY